MQIVKSKTKSTFIALILMLTISITLISITLPSSNAHTPPYTVPTDAYVTVSPGTIGLGQYCTIVVWLAQFSPTSSGLSGQRWDGFLITITQPDGTNTTIGPWTCRSAAASDYQVFTPTELGNYTIVFSWPGENVTTGNQPLPNTADLADVGDIFLGSTSKTCTLTVASTQVPSWPEPPLPTDYWTTPINDQNRGWSILASNWLNGPWLTNNFQTEGTAPTTAHVLWTEPFTASAPGTKGYPGGIADAHGQE